MDLYKEILIEALSREKMQVSFTNLKTEDPNEIVRQTCYQTIQRIRQILCTDTLDDFQCIENIVELLEGIGTNSGPRHDF